MSRGIAADFDLVELLRTKPNQPVAIGEAQAGGARGKKRPVLICAIGGSNGKVYLQKREPPEFSRDFQEVDLDTAGKVGFEGLRIYWRIRAGKLFATPKPVAGQEAFDADKVGSPIVLRHWQPGDRFQPIGMDASVKLQDIFTNKRVPRARRHYLIVAATSRKEIFWVEGLRISERFKLTKSTNRRLQWRWQRL